MPKLSLEEALTRIDKSGECHLWTGAKHPFGYGQAATKLAHRLTWENTNGPIPKGLCVLHKCDNPPCCNPEHLFLGTKGDNARDCAAKERSSTRKLTGPQVLEIRARRANGETGIVLARAFGVSEKNIGHIVHRETWKHL